MPKQGPRSIKTKEKIKSVTRTGKRADVRAPPPSCYVFDFPFCSKTNKRSLKKENQKRNTNGGRGRADVLAPCSCYFLIFSFFYNE